MHLWETFYMVCYKAESQSLSAKKLIQMYYHSMVDSNVWIALNQLKHHCHALRAGTDIESCDGNCPFKSGPILNTLPHDTFPHQKLCQM